jgi:hypothetical protein
MDVLTYVRTEAEYLWSAARFIATTASDDFMKRYPVIRFLRSYQSPETKALGDRLNRTGLWNVFNPSVVSMTGGLAMAFRAGRWHGDKPFRAYYLSPANSARKCCSRRAG